MAWFDKSKVFFKDLSPKCYTCGIRPARWSNMLSRVSFKKAHRKGACVKP